MKSVNLILALCVGFFVASSCGMPADIPKSKFYVTVEEIFGKQESTSEKDGDVPKKINRSIFVVPTLKPVCAKGFKLNQNGKCEQKVEVDNNGYFSFILNKLFSYDYDDGGEYDEYTYDQFKNNVKKDEKPETNDGSTRLSIPFY